MQLFVGLVACLLLAGAPAEAHGPEELDKQTPSRKGIEEIVVTASRQPITAASSKEINMRDFLLRPHSTTQEIMNNVPGLLVVQHQGGGKAFQYFIRGFDVDHGTDFLLVTDGMPVNLVSQAHGQGWADSNYVIPETLEGIRLFKGPYFAEFGDFAVAGALAFKTKDEFDQDFIL
ncbi:MAG: TonB-dependent receptor plug domain-containing protein, partial [Alphaproteobacteria bacterium]|nr:TonB-dependent receptor plug domain-containing protein [Alphaproteobacteria bacterium]